MRLINSAQPIFGAPYRIDNTATGPKLSDQLKNESANSSFKSDGSLSDDAIANSRQIIKSQDINNPNVPDGFGKFSTETYQSPSGDFQTHFYQNPETGMVDYSIDYKSVFNQPFNQR